uniref:Uncharacterized protein n=1 Tax=Molossus molossus TaxID=27622 RepID=A0A7J8DQH6_MOLMO|nr:hypothetical protein HJG59_009220 [Molossus molossus]
MTGPCRWTKMNYVRRQKIHTESNGGCSKGLSAVFSCRLRGFPATLGSFGGQRRRHVCRAGLFPPPRGFRSRRPLIRTSHIHQNDQWPSARCGHRSGGPCPRATGLLGAAGEAPRFSGFFPPFFFFFASSYSCDFLSSLG